MKIAALLKYFLPPVCPACHAEVLRGGAAICEGCRGNLDLVNPPFCHGCGGDLDGILDLCSDCLREPPRPWRAAAAPLRFEGLGRLLIHRLKYRGGAELCRPLGKLMAEAAIAADVGGEVVVPMPTHWARRLARGYNQAELLALALAPELGVGIASNILRRNKLARRQAKLDHEQRHRNVRGVFSVANGEIVKNRDILLVDDVLTTGATLAEASRTLLAAGAKSVDVLVAARG